MCTGKIGLKHCLYQRGVPDVPDGNCRYGKATETVRHILLACPNFQSLCDEMFGRRSGALGREGNREAILNVPKRAIQAAKFMLRRGLLGQFGAEHTEEIVEA